MIRLIPFFAIAMAFLTVGIVAETARSEVIPGAFEISATYGKYYNSLELTLPLPSDTLDLFVENGKIYSIFAGMIVPTDFAGITGYLGINFDFLVDDSSADALALPFSDADDEWHFMPGYHSWGVSFKVLRSFFWRTNLFARFGGAWTSGVTFQNEGTGEESFPYGKEVYLKGDGLSYSMGGGLEWYLPFTETLHLPSIPLIFEFRKNWITLDDFENPDDLDVPDEVNLGGYFMSFGFGIRFL